MKKNIYRLLLSLLIGYCLNVSAETTLQQPSVQCSVTATAHEKIKLLLVIVGHTTQELTDLVAVIKKDLEFSRQFDVAVTSVPELSNKSDLKEAATRGYSLAIFINAESRSNAIEWRLYDTQLAEMVKGTKYHKRGELVRGWAHNISDMLWPELTAQDGFFSTKIAYCKEISDKRHRHKLKHIFVADYDGSNEQRVIATPTINVAPRFNKDQNKPLLFYSESTNANIRMMIADLQGHAKVASNFDGVNMLPSFTADGSKLVYCASHGHGDCQLYYYDKKTFKQLTDNKGNNISPSFSDDGRLLFYCSDAQSGKPQIYCFNMVTGTQTQITFGPEPCFSPSYCSKNGKLAYAKMIKGTMQLFICDEKTGNHRQLTFDAGSKDECSWSPCGNYLLYSTEKGNKGRIAMLNLLTNEHRFITAGNEVCSYPTWSPSYAQYPVIA